MINVFIENPNYLSAKAEKLKLIKRNEVFVELPEPYGGYFISQYARLYSKRKSKGKLKTEYLSGDKKRKNQLKPKYMLYDRHGNPKWFFTSRLVASVFCENTDPERKTQVHHKDRTPFNNKYDNLIWLSPAEHKLLETGKTIFLYNPENKSRLYFKSIPSLCECLNIHKSQLNRILYKGKKPKIVLEDGTLIYDYKGRSVYIGVTA